MKNGITPVIRLLDQYRLAGVEQVKLEPDKDIYEFRMALESMSNEHLISCIIAVPNEEAIAQYDWGCSDAELDQWITEAKQECAANELADRQGQTDA